MLHSVSYPAVDCSASIPSYSALLIEGVSFFLGDFMYHSPLRSFCLTAGSTATAAISVCHESGSTPLVQCIAITRFIHCI